MSLTYDFKFGPTCAGLSAVVTETLTGVEVDDSPVTLDSAGSAQLALVEGSYQAVIAGSTRGGIRWGKLSAVGQFDIAESIEAGGGGVGAAETAYFIATGPADVTDGAGAAGNLTFEADDRHGELPSWASIVSGDVVLSEDAGTCAWAFTGLFDYDFSATTPPDSDGAIISPFSAVNPVGTTPISADDVGDGQDDQTSPAARAGGITLPGSFTVVGLPIAYSDDQITPIDDGTATPRVALTITRIAQAAVLPE